MRPRKAVAFALIVALAGAGCSRVAFIKTDPARGDFERTTDPVVVHDTPEMRNRDVARTSLDLSQQRLSEGNLNAAQDYARKALKADPNSGDAYTMLAVIADEQGNDAEAGADYKRATELDPSGGTYNNYGAWLCANNRSAESLGWFDQALTDPSYTTPAAALANAGRCALDAGQADRAQRDLHKAIELEPNNPVALDALARTAYKAGNYMEARAFSERRLAAAPATAEALQLASQIEDKLGDSAASARYVRRLREEFPGVAQGSSGGSKAP